MYLALESGLPYSSHIGTMFQIKTNDVTGKLVYESQNTSKSNGQNFAFFDVSNFKPAVYRDWETKTICLLSGT